MIFLVIVGVMQGCANGPHGGCALAENRLQRIGAELTGAVSSDRQISLCVFDSSELAAFSHSDGRILVSSALVERLSDDELAAAIAHELGHLINDGHLRTTAALSGGRGPVDIEFAADQTAAELFRSLHRDAGALQTMLAKVADDRSLSGESQRRIHERIARLQSLAEHR